MKLVNMDNKKEKINQLFQLNYQSEFNNGRNRFNFDKFEKDILLNMIMEYPSLEKFYDKIKKDENLHISIACLLYINLKKNEEMLRMDGLNNDEIEELITFIIKDCTYKIGINIYDGILKCTDGLENPYIFSIISNLEVFYNKKDLLNKYRNGENKIIRDNCEKCAKELIELTIELTEVEKKILREKILQLNLDIYESNYLAFNFKNIFVNYAEYINNEFYIDDKIIKEYIEIINETKNKKYCHTLLQIKDLNPIFYNRINEGFLTYQQICELLCINKHYESYDQIENINQEILFIFNKQGIHSNFDSCKQLYKLSKIINYNYHYLFSISIFDVLKLIQNKNSKEIELIVKILLKTLDIIDYNKILSSKYETVQKHISHFPIGSAEDRESANAQYESEEIIESSYDSVEKFINKIKNLDDDTKVSNLNYNNIIDYHDEYSYQVFNWIKKLENILINDRFYENIDILFNFLEDNNNIVDYTFSNSIKGMLVNEGYINEVKVYKLIKK